MPSHSTKTRFEEASFSTREVPPERRFAYWLDMLSSTYVSLESTPSDSDDFFGAIRKKNVGEVDLSIVQSTSPLVRRTRQLIRESHAECLLVHCAHTGKARVEQGGRIAELSPGDITVYLSTEPYDLRFNGWFDTRVIKIPIAAIKPYVRSIADLTAVVIKRPSLEGAMLRGMVANVWNERLAGNSKSTASLSDALIQVTSAALQSIPRAVASDLSNLDAYYLSRAKAYVHSNLRSETLGMDEVAAAVGVSPRHLSRLFKSEPLTLSKYIWAERLEGCRRDLSRTRRAKIGLSDVAYSWGFSNASHFSKAFRSHFGVSPSEWAHQQQMRG